MTTFSTTIQSFSSQPTATFTPAAPENPVPADFADAMLAKMDRALIEGDVAAYRQAKRSLRSHRRYHAMQFRDASRFPISHDDHLASTAHQANYYDKGDVERMSVGLAEVPEWRPPLLRKMDASAGIEQVFYDVPEIGIVDDWLSIAQRDQIHFDRDREELPSDYILSALAEAERLGCSIEDLDRGMRAKTSNTYSPAE